MSQKSGVDFKYSITAVVAATFFVAACSQVPDWANPVEIYEDVTGQNTAEETTQAKVDLGDTSFPNLADVPEQRRSTIKAERGEIASGLAADRSQAEYSDEILKGGSSKSAPPPSADVVAKAPMVEKAPTAKVSEKPMPKVEPAKAEAPAQAPAPMAEAEKVAEPVMKPVEAPVVEKVAVAAPVPVANDDGQIGRVNWGSRKEALPERLSEKAETKAELAKVRITEEAAKPAPAPVEKPAVVAEAPKPVTLDERVEPVKVTRKEMPKAVEPVVAPAPATVNAASVTDIYQNMLTQSSATRVIGDVNQGFNSPSSMQFPADVAALVPPAIAETLNSPISAPSLNLGYQVDPSSAVTVDPTVLGDAAANQAATILFGNGSSYLSSADRRVLRSVANTLKEKGGFLRVVGHASSRTQNMQVVEHLALNQRLSENRAKAVAKELTRLGVAAELILVEARGDSQPIYFESMPAGEAGNRRVEIFHEV